MQIRSTLKPTLYRWSIVIQAAGLLIIFGSWYIENTKISTYQDKVSKVNEHINFLNIAQTRTNVFLTGFIELDTEVLKNPKDTNVVLYTMRLMREFTKEALAVRDYSSLMLHLDSTEYPFKWLQKELAFSYELRNYIKKMHTPDKFGELYDIAGYRQRFITDTLRFRIAFINSYVQKTSDELDDSKRTHFWFYIIGSILLAVSYFFKYILVSDNP